ncbi:formyl transferase [Methylobacterium planeticum]|uniref:phosphoribosylglycinamide formyltransferase 1 n=1 Tax=Methylobacterium planeticum TaxID=2615211 RepID=A0A6N6MTX1_9HYPH|nr:formyl transferase [Methylobacterium planeticum]KAB1074871.1 formyl transferase [Methylobacterium planeticum]
MNKDILLVASEGLTTNVVYHRLVSKFGTFRVIIEAPVPKKLAIRRKLRNVGPFRTSSQLAFLSIVRPMLSRRGRARISDILAEANLDCTPVPESVIDHVPSINSQASAELVKAIKPKVVVVNGTSIISPTILECMSCSVLNTHTGITPRYRGSHGGYWALRNGEPQYFGATVHLVDAGIDTGPIVGQTTSAPTEKDNFATYPLLQIAAAIPILERAVEDALSGNLKHHPALGTSRLWHHPGIVEYLTGLASGIM